MGLFEHFPYTNYHSLNIEWAIEKIKELLQQGETLYGQLQQWKTDTDTELAAWKTQTLADLTTWEENLSQEVESWKTATVEEFEQQFAEYQTAFEQIKTSAEGYMNAAQTSARQASDSAEAAAQSAIDAASSAASSIAALENEASAFDATATYAAGDYVLYNSVMYRFTADHAAGAWTGIDAAAVKIGGEVSSLKDSLANSVHELAENLTELIHLNWTKGEIESNTGADITNNNAVRTADYIEKNKVSEWTIDPHSGALYVHRYNYSDGTYTWLGRNQQINTGNLTTWLKSLDGTHFRFVNFQSDVNYPSTWSHLSYTSNLGTEIESLEISQNKEEILERNVGYWRQYLEIPKGSGHSASNDILAVDIKAGQPFMLRFSMNRMYNIQIYARYNDGTSERVLLINASDYPYSKSLYHISPKSKDIIGISQFTVTEPSLRTCITEVILENGITNIIDYYRASLTSPQIKYQDSIAYFVTGRARFDANTIHQSIAVWDNQVWEFGEGKATYDGIVYELENGHANCCNWGEELHGNYPFLYCPKLTDKTINVFSFNGTEFTLENTITIQINGTGSLNAYIDEKNGFIYGFIASANEAFFVADMTGAVLYSKPIMYKIPTIQNVKLHNGILYVVSGFGTTASPNYLNEITTDGSLIGRYPMRNIGEIEGIDFLGDEMILASYYNFYIHPTKLPNPFRVTDVYDQLN